MRSCDECGGCPNCERQDDPEFGKCESCCEQVEFAADARDEGYNECWECWQKTLNLWSRMAEEDRITRGQEGGWCDL